MPSIDAATPVARSAANGACRRQASGLVLAAAGVTVAAASSKSADASKHRVQTIQLVAKQTQDVLLVLATPGHGPVGNQFLTTDDLYRQGHKVGHDASICQFMADLGQA